MSPSDPMPSHQVALIDVLARFRPGSFGPPWSWDDEQRWLDQQTNRRTGIRGGYQADLEEYLRGRGSIEQPILLGDDGRIWDGHHRVVAARRLGFDLLLAECFCGTDSLCIAWHVAELLGTRS